MRLEYKYLIPIEHLRKFRSDILPFLTCDKYAIERKEKEYTVRSIYFDNRKLDYYHEKIDGIKIRKKVRIRGYNTLNGKNVVFLEIKRKNQNFISKNRSPIYFENLDSLLEKGNIEDHVLFSNLADKYYEDGMRFFYNYINKSLRPTTLVVYEREAYVCKFNDNIRITFDKNLRYLAFPKISDLFDERQLSLAMTNNVILEIKFHAGFPMWLQNVISKYRIIRQPVSKYIICLDAYTRLHPLNDNIRESFSKPVFI